MTSITAILLTLPSALVIGHSVEGRPIEAFHVGGSGPVVLVVGCIHGNECAALPVIARLEGSHPEQEDLWVIPEANPDGTAHDVRGNAHGVDLNRNFPAGWKAGPRDGYYPGPRALSEPESRAVLAFIRRIKPAVTVWFHQPQTVVRAWGRSRTAARRYAKAVGMRYRSELWPAGAITRWQNDHGETSFVVELAPGPLSAANVGHHVGALLHLAG
ncbi:MAG TPA: M14 family zinc carboxypeptidase [Gaiellaceae bacterium]|jgi:protein MpaA